MSLEVVSSRMDAENEEDKKRIANTMVSILCFFACNQDQKGLYIPVRYAELIDGFGPDMKRIMELRAFFDGDKDEFRCLGIFECVEGNVNSDRIKLKINEHLTPVMLNLLIKHYEEYL